jgi:hypothetical protein
MSPSSSPSSASSRCRPPRRSSRLRADRIAIVTHSACHQLASLGRRGSCSGYGDPRRGGEGLSDFARGAAKQLSSLGRCPAGHLKEMLRNPLSSALCKPSGSWTATPRRLAGWRSPLSLGLGRRAAGQVPSAIAAPTARGGPSRQFSTQRPDDAATSIYPYAIPVGLGDSIPARRLQRSCHDVSANTGRRTPPTSLRT